MTHLFFCRWSISSTHSYSNIHHQTGSPLLLQVVYLQHHSADTLSLLVELERSHLHLRVEHNPRPFSLSDKSTQNQCDDASQAEYAEVWLKPGSRLWHKTENQQFLHSDENAHGKGISSFSKQKHVKVYCTSRNEEDEINVPIAHSAFRDKSRNEWMNEEL